MAIQPGTDIGRYHILEQLGEGGMAVVYKAYDTRVESEVAVKVIRTGSLPPDSLPRIQKRFQIEAKKMAQMNHPNIVKVMDFGEFEGAPYLVMPYLAGGTLKDWLGKRVPWQEAVEILLPIADALGYAHGKGLVHRDIKPSNILITETGKPMLSDFGVAKVLESVETLDLTLTGMGVGTPEYMAPEMGMSREFDQRADIYSLGVVLYELVTGKKPFSADTPLAVLFKHASDPLPHPSRFVDDLPEAVEHVLFKALAKDPADRYQAMAELGQTLKKLLSAQSTIGHDQKTKPQPDKEPERVVPETRVENKSPIKKEGEKKPFDTRWLISGLGAIGIGLIIFVGIKFFEGRELKIKKMTSEQDHMTMVFVPKGEFAMGLENGNSDESQVHTVSLDAYWIDQTEVTNAQYSVCVRSGVCGQPSNTKYFDDSNYRDHPVVYLTWNDASGYCAWAGRRLPTEAEWEKAARGTDGRTYPWGEGIACSQANYGNCDDFLSTSPVGYYGSAVVSPYGAYDMAGNVWEWVADWYGDEYYQGSPSDNPTGPDSGSNRVLRGGSWSNFEWAVRSSNRSYDLTGARDNSIGFRCAVSATSP